MQYLKQMDTLNSPSTSDNIVEGVDKDTFGYGRCRGCGRVHAPSEGLKGTLMYEVEQNDGELVILLLEATEDMKIYERTRRYSKVGFT